MLCEPPGENIHEDSSRSDETAVPRGRSKQHSRKFSFLLEILFFARTSVQHPNPRKRRRRRIPLDRELG